jgi:hypothetical protein
MNEYWWFGFDCAHANDLQPGSVAGRTFDWQQYRDIAYVKDEVESLASQLKKRGI